MAEEFKVTFDGYEITELLRVTSLDRGVGPSRSSRTSKRNDKKGVHYLGTSSDLLTHEMGFVLRYDLIHKRRELARILNGTEPKKLIYSDEPDKFYWAFPKGDINVDEKVFLGFGTISWEIFDGVAYSVKEYTFENNGSDPRVIEINNPGTEPMLLELEAEFTSDCGFIGLQNNDLSTSALFGTIEEVDGYHFDTSDLLFDDHLTEDRGWVLNTGVVPPVTPNPQQVGTVSYQVDPSQPAPIDPNEGFVRATSYGTGSEWHGPSVTKTIPVDKNGKYPVNWKATWRFDFNPNGSNKRPSNVGHGSLTFIDQNNAIICSVVVEDNNPSQERSDIAFYVGNKRVWDTRETTSFYTTQRPNQSNVMVEKIGSEIAFAINYANLKKTFITQAPNVELRKATWYMAQYGTRTPMQNNLLRAINIRKHNVQNWKDVPNKFGTDDVLDYKKTGDNILCTINGLQGLQYRDPGSTLIYAPPGVSTMFLSWSDFATAPIVKLKGRAAYV
ncbi:phage tail family protein [Enterococcus asini]|uniref:distal tail protein Dit n=1 Tax=Enterococcus asini TaxID=57732 RepID=UPI0028913698|nr:distal tail protein Dit [Enterococcus asini]MDT2756979.1 phage tail family protein [Enterococcus asini]